MAQVARAAPAAAQITGLAGAANIPGAAEAEVLHRLDQLVRETYLLWDQEWVGFSWRNYTYEHMQRVRGLARTLGRETGADARVIEFAATLHDVTKSYDGEIMLGADGKRLLDESGFWQNEVLLPSRRNRVTELYDQLGLAGTLHNVSGGRIADALLAELGFLADLRARVEQAIREHLKAEDGASLEGKVLYDADTIDANIGLPALYRNIQISLRAQDTQYAKRGEYFVEWLRQNLPSYLDIYLGEKIPAWIEGKRREFLPKMTTAPGLRLAEERIERLKQLNAELLAELDELEQALEHGRISVIRYFMENRSNPRLTEQIALLEQRWSGEPHASGRAELLQHIRAEVGGGA